MPIYAQLMLVLSLWLTGLSALATTLTAPTQQLNPLAGATYLEDPSGTLTIEQVRAMDAQFLPWSGPGQLFNAGFTASAYWIRLPLSRTNDAPPDWLLEIDYAGLQELDFHAPDRPVVRTGSERAFDSRPMFDRFFIFPLHLTPQTQTYYLRATSRYALTVPLTVWKPDAYRASQLRFHALQFLYYGVLGVLALYGLVIFLAIGDGRFAIYSAYIVSAGLGVFAGNGYGRLFVWPNLPQFDEIAQSLFFSMTAFFNVWFVRRLACLESRSGLERALQLSQWLFALLCVLSFGQLVWPQLLLPLNQLLVVNSICMGLIVTLAGVKAYRQRRSGIRFFLLGWVVLWMGICVAALRAFGLIASNGLTSYAVQLSIAIEVLLVALALGELLREEYRAHLNMQAQALATNRALLDLSQASEEKLRQAVQERTEQLEASWREEKNLREQYVRIGSMISHEFRTPLSIIHSQATLMRKEYEKGIDEVVKRLDAIGSASQRLKSMFDKWLYSDSLHETLALLVPQPLDLEDWVRQQLQAQQHLLTQHILEFEPSQQMLPRVMADDYHLELVLSNLIDNAAKYAPTRSTITVSLLQKPGFAGMAVTDQGPGIEPEVQDKIFREFFRVAPESQVRGVGLGLSIVQRIVQAHAGHVELISSPGCGATFCVWLPCSVS